MWFDPHWHARDEEQAEKETIEHSLAVAEAAGGTAIAAMPNTTRLLISLERCRDYLAIADKVQSPVRFYVHIGLTADVEQVQRAVEACRTEPRIIGMKAYWGKSTGNLSIAHEEKQFCVLETLVKEGFTGVLVNHCEKESLMNDVQYEPNYPLTWSLLCRPEQAEIQSFHDLLRLAEEVGFAGTLHIAHVSTREVVDAIAQYSGKVRLSCGVTPHHLLFDYTKLKEKQGFWYKCNPPLRSPATQQNLQLRLSQGKIPIIESDHAPHTAEEKQSISPPSGIASGLSWSHLPQYLRTLHLSEPQIHQVTFAQAVKLYGLNIEPRKAEVNLAQLEKLTTHYAFNPFSGVFSP